MPRSFLVKQRKISKQLKEDNVKSYSDEESTEVSYDPVLTPENDGSEVNHGSPMSVTKVKEREEEKTKDNDTQTPPYDSNDHQNIPQIFQAGTTPIYVFNPAIRADHMTTIPVQYVHPNFCYPPYIHYENILPARVLPKEQIPPMSNMPAQNRVRTSKADSLPISTAPLSNGRAPQIVQQHIVENGIKEKKYECHVCKSTFALQRLLNRHMKTHSFYKRYQCPYCDKGFNDTFDLKRHVRTHTGIKPFKCNLCDKAFTQRCSLEAHKTRVHNVVYQYGFRERRAKLFVCEDCGETFQESGDYMKHLQEKHPESAAKTRFKRSLATKMAKSRRVEMEA